MRLLVKFARAEGVDQHRDRLGDADGIGQLHLAAFRQLRGDDVLGDVAAPCSGRAIDLRGSLPEKAPPPWRPMPPYVSTMILRPVSPAVAHAVRR